MAIPICIVEEIGDVSDGRSGVGHDSSFRYRRSTGVEGPRGHWKRSRCFIQSREIRELEIANRAIVVSRRHGRAIGECGDDGRETDCRLKLRWRTVHGGHLLRALRRKPPWLDPHQEACR